MVKRLTFDVLPLALRIVPLVGILSLSACGDNDPTYQPNVSVNFSATALSTVSPDLMGIHTAVYDGLLTRSATTEMYLREGAVISLRYPGGSYADLYHWETHTGTMTPAAGFGGNSVYIDRSANFGQFVKLLDRLVGSQAFITVNWGMDSAGTGPGLPQEAAAWVAYANALPTDTTVIGVDPTGFDWQTAGYWAGLRASMPLPTEDGKNFLRIGRAAPVGIKYWEIGNEIYGNGFYYGNETSAGWEVDMRAPYNGMDGRMRKGNPNLHPKVYGQGVKEFATLMKAVDPTIQVGTVIHWPFTDFSKNLNQVDWDESVLPEACPSTDLAVNHWYPGRDELRSLLTIPGEEIPKMFADLRAEMAQPAMNCGATRGGTMPIAVTEWGPNVFRKEIGEAYNPKQPDDPKAPRVRQKHTQVAGIFAAESYANFMEQGAVAVHWAQLHGENYLDADLGGGTDVPSYGYHGALIAKYLARGGDEMIAAKSDWKMMLSHASRHKDGSVAIMLVNIHPSSESTVTVNVTGQKLPATGKRYTYAPVNGDMDGPVSEGETISSSDSGSTVVVSVPAYAVVVVVFPGT